MVSGSSNRSSDYTSEAVSFTLPVLLSVSHNVMVCQMDELSVSVAEARASCRVLNASQDYKVQKL